MCGSQKLIIIMRFVNTHKYSQHALTDVAEAEEATGADLTSGSLLLKLSHCPA